MKNALYIVCITVVLLVSACGEANTSIDKTSEDTGEGGVAFTFRSAQFKAAEDYPAPTNVRVFIRRFENQDLKLNTLVDVAVPTDTTIIVNVQANSGYQIDAISYVERSSTLKSVLKFDQVKGITVAPDSVSNVALVLEPIGVTYSVPDTVDKGDQFSISANLGNFMSIDAYSGTQLFSYVKADSLYSNQESKLSTDHYASYSKGPEVELNFNNISVGEFEGRYSYFQISSRLFADEFYKSDEYKYTFIYNYPNPYVDDTLKTFIKVPDGGIGVTVTY